MKTLNQQPTLSEQFTHWIYQNCVINNGDALVEAFENPNNLDNFLLDSGLPLDTEVEY